MTDVRRERWNSTPWPGWERQEEEIEEDPTIEWANETTEGTSPRRLWQPGNLDGTKYGRRGGTTASSRCRTPPEVRGRDTLRPQGASAWTKSGSAQGCGVGSAFKQSETTLWDMLSCFRCAPIKDVEQQKEEISSSGANSTSGGYTGAGSGATYGRSMQRFTTTVESRLRSEEESKEGRDTHIIIPGQGGSGEYHTTDKVSGVVHELGIKVLKGEEEQHRRYLVNSIYEIVVYAINRSHYRLTMNLNPAYWQIHEEDSSGFMGYMAEVIEEVVENAEEEMEVSTGRSRGGRQREFQIVVYHDTELLRDQFDKAYAAVRDKGLRKLLMSSSQVQPEASGRPKQSPAFTSPTGSIAKRDAQFSSTSPDREVGTACQLCGSEEKGPLALILSPPYQLRGRMPRSFEACKECRHTECERNRVEREQEEVEARQQYEKVQTRQQRMQEREEELLYAVRETEMAQQREKVQATSSAPTWKRDQYGSRSRGVISDWSQSVDQDERGRQEESQPRLNRARIQEEEETEKRQKQAYETGARQDPARTRPAGASSSPSCLKSEKRSVRYEDEIEDPPTRFRQYNRTQENQKVRPEQIPREEEHRKAKLELLRSQTTALQATALHSAKAMQTAQQVDTKSQMEWADQRVKNLEKKAKEFIDQIQSERSSVPPGSQEVGESFLKIWRLAYEETKMAATWITNLFPWLIHIFAQLLQPLTEWIYEEKVAQHHLAARKGTTVYYSITASSSGKKPKH